eukprot:Lankesteria_metandrocarpae@DN3207_c1_g1_i2.p1
MSSVQNLWAVISLMMAIGAVGPQIKVTDDGIGIVRDGNAMAGLVIGPGATFTQSGGSKVMLNGREYTGPTHLSTRNMEVVVDPHDHTAPARRSSSSSSSSCSSSSGTGNTYTTKPRAIPEPKKPFDRQFHVECEYFYGDLPDANHHVY